MLDFRLQLLLFCIALYLFVNESSLVLFYCEVEVGIGSNAPGKQSALLGVGQNSFPFMYLVIYEFLLTKVVSNCQLSDFSSMNLNPFKTDTSSRSIPFNIVNIVKILSLLSQPCSRYSQRTSACTPS